MIEIRYKDRVLNTVPITSKCVHRKEVMKDDYIRLSWESNDFIKLPISSYITYNGIKYSLLSDYVPNEVEDSRYSYEPEFRSPNMLLSKKIFIYKDIDKSPETEWGLTGDIDTFAKVVTDAIKFTTDRYISIKIDSGISGVRSIEFANTDILSGLNKIADEYDTEWWFNGDVLNISKCEWGDAIELKVGDNINAPRIDRKQEQITRFIAFGSDRNITQDYKPSTNLVNYKNRLTLPKDKYPNGYIDIKDDLSVEEILPKVFVFDNIYPSSKLTISNVKSVLKYVYDTEGNKVEIGVDDEGNPLYDTYFVFTFEIPDFDFDIDSIIPNEELKGSFTSGKLIGMTFLLAYKDGVYTIKPNQENLPNVYYNPEDGDGVILLNIDMPNEYVHSAELELEQAVLKEIDRVKSDYNTYSFNTDRTANQDNVLVGRKVKYINKGYELETRIISVEAKLDNYNDKSVVIGNDTVKSPFEELRENVYDASRNLDVVKALNDATSTIQNSMIQGQREFLENLEKWGKLWTLRKDGETIHTVFDAFVQGGITMYSDDLSEASPSLFDAFPHDGKTIKRRADGVYYAVGSGSTGLSEITIKVNNVDYESEDGFVQLPDYPTRVSQLRNDLNFLTKTNTDKYYTSEEWVKSQGYVKSEDLSVYAKRVWVDTNFAYKNHKHNWSDINNTPTTLAGYGITDVYTKTQSNSRYLGVGANAVSATKLNSTRKIWGQIFDGTQDVEGDFVNGDGIMSFNKHWNFNKDIVSQGGVTMYGSKGVISPSLFDSFPHDNVTIKRRVDGVYYAVGGSGGISKVSVSVNDKEYLPDSNGKIAIPNYPSRLSHLTNDVGYTTQQWVENQKYANKSELPTKVSQLTNDSGYVTSSVVDGYATQSWSNGRFALKSHKHNWSDITNTPTTIGGYGIVDAVNNSSNQIINGIKTFSNNVILYESDGWEYSGIGVRLLKSFRNGASVGNYYSGIHFGNSYSSFQLASSAGDISGFRFRSQEAGKDWKGWKDIAFADSNVASATKLYNTRALWGNLFDGTKNVDGDIVTEKDYHELKLGRSGFNEVQWIEHGGRWRFMGSAGQVYADFNRGSLSLNGNLTNVTKIILRDGKEIYYDAGKDAIIIDSNVITNGAITMNLD